MAGPLVALVASNVLAPAWAIEILVRVPTRCELSLDGSVRRRLQPAPSPNAPGPPELVAHARILDDRGRGVSGATVRLTVAVATVASASPRPEPLQGRTDDAGRTTMHVPALTRPATLSLRFEGDERHGACASRRAVDPTKAFPTLTLDGPARVREGGPEAAAVFEARTDSLGATLRARLWRGERWDELGSGTGDAEGRWRFSLLGAHARGLGPVTLRVELVGDGKRNEARIERTLLLTRPVTLTAHIDDEVALGEQLAFRGLLVAADAPLANTIVTLVRDGATLAVLRTDPRGAFRGGLEATLLGQGTHVLQAAFAPTAPGLEPAASEAVKVTVVQGGALVGRAALLTTGVLLFALGLWVTAMRASRSRVLRMDPAPKGNEPPPLSPMRKLWRRMTASRVIEGHVQDGITGRPIVGARLVVLDQETVSTAGGAFRIGPFDLARVALDVGADGYAGERFDIELPTSDAQHVMLWSWREKVLRRFAEVAAKLLPGPPLGQRTLADLRRDGLALLGPAGPAFAAIIERLEDACYAPRGLDADRFRALLEAVSILEHTSPSVPHTATPQPGAQRVPMGPDTDGA